jgi:hypothetical protein
LADVFRSVVGRVKGELDRRRKDEDTPVVDGDDDPDGEPLPPLTAEDVELAKLDEEDAPPVEIDQDKGIVDLFGDIDPLPSLPLTGPHEIGLVLIVQRLARVSEDLLADARVRRVLALLGDRLTLTVGPDGITVRGLLRTRHTPWDKVKQLSFTSRYDQFKGRLVTQIAEDISGRLLPVPIPGLNWLIRRIIGGIGNLWENRAFTAEELEQMRAGLGYTLTDIERRGLDIELAGALRLVAFFSFGLSMAILSEADDRGITVTGIDEDA